MTRTISIPLLASLLFPLSAAAQSAATAPATGEDLQAAMAEANYQISTFSGRLLTCAAQVGKDSHEIARLNSELGKARAEIDTLRAKTPAPKDSTPEAKPPEPPK